MEKQSPLISVIMPLYNAERFVGESIGNILGQTVGDFELIVIDDASTDSSYDIASRYAAQDARIVLMRNDANHGAAYTRNRGLETARGSFITFMDADDRCSPERFARQTAFFGQHPQIACAAVTIRCSGRTMPGNRRSRIPPRTKESGSRCFSAARSQCRRS